MNLSSITATQAVNTNSTFAYSDGDAVELSLLKTITQATNVSTLSPVLANAIIDWPTEYHLSASRHNLLRPFNIGSKHRILELGCGCGAMTRYLGETGATVIAVEGSSRRTQIAAQRCRDLPNVSINCGNLVNFQSDEKFDYVTLIGVLEYAPMFVEGEDPVVAALTHARSFLKEGGALIVAIENQLGLKYFNGCAEDHTGIPYFGLHGLYEAQGPVTFGRQALSEKLEKAGFHQREFFYPFPDYKLPGLILSTPALAEAHLGIADLLLQHSGGHQPETQTRAFAEDQAWRAVTENKLLPELANSFLIVAGHNESELAMLDQDFLAATYTSDRLPRYATETVFRKAAQGSITVEKNPLFPEQESGSSLAAIAGGMLQHHVGTSCDYVPGELFIVELQRRMARDEGIEAIIDWAGDWLALVKGALIGDGICVPGYWLDRIPQNFIRTADGGLTAIDAEWSISVSIPASWVICRGLMSALAFCPTSPSVGDTCLQQILQHIGVSAGITLDDESLRNACALEAQLRFIVHGKHCETEMQHLWRVLTLPLRSAIGVQTYQEMCEDKCMALENEIRRMKSTVSWQITKPLRALWNIPKRIFQKTDR